MNFNWIELWQMELLIFDEIKSLAISNYRWLSFYSQVRLNCTPIECLRLTEGRSRRPPIPVLDWDSKIFQLQSNFYSQIQRSWHSTWQGRAKVCLLFHFSYENFANKYAIRMIPSTFIPDVLNFISSTSNHKWDFESHELSWLVIRQLYVMVSNGE